MIDGSSAMAKLAVVFQSGKGHTKALAVSILKGINSVDGTNGSLFEIHGRDITDGRFANEGLMSSLDSCDGIVFGCATYMGSASAIFKGFLEAAFQPRWFEQRWKDKIAAGFTNSASQNGDKLTTLFQLSIFAMQMGMVWVGVSDLPGNSWSGGARSDLNRLGRWVGAMGQSNADEEMPSIGDIDTAERLGARVALITRRFKDGIPFETERLQEREFRQNNIARKNALSGLHE
jgi:NAD(P)H dehydrogenase (quinone)